MATTADSVLVNAAFKEGQTGAIADVPNMKPLYDHQAKIGEQYMGMVTGIMDEIKLEKEQEEALKIKRLKPFKDIADQAYQTLYSQKEPMPDKVVQAVTAEVERLQEEFEKVNTEGEGDTKQNERARLKITGELQRITNEAINTRANFMKIGQAAGDWNEGLIDPNKIDPMKSILDIKGMDKNDNISVKFVDGKLTFTTKNYSEIRGHVEKAGPGAVYVEGQTNTGTTSEVIERYGDEISMNSEQMFKALPNKDLANDERILKDNKNFSLQGTADGKNGEPNYFDNDYAFNEEKANFASGIKDEKQFQDIASRRTDGINAPSFTQALRSRIDIPLSVLDNMFYDDDGQTIDLRSVFASLDTKGGKSGKGDGVINQEDLVGLKGEDLEAFKRNHGQMVDALTNINNPAFDLNTSKDLLADYYTNLKKQAYDANYKKNSKSDTPKYQQKGSADWLRYQKWLEAKDPVTDYKSKNLEYDIVVDDDKIGSKVKTTSDALILKQEDLKTLQNKDKDSIFTGEFVNLPGAIKVGYTPGKGFVEVEDVKLTGDKVGQKQFGLWPKDDNPTYFKSIKEIFNYYNIPDQYIGINTQSNKLTW